MADMARKEILPAVESYAASLASSAAAKKAVDESLSCSYEKRLVKKLSTLVDMIDAKAEELSLSMVQLENAANIQEEAFFIRDVVLPKMCELRAAADEAETLTAKSYWPFPTYGDLMFSEM